MKDKSIVRSKIDNAVRFLHTKINGPINFAIILGTGLEQLTRVVKIALKVEYDLIPDFPISTAPTHKGEMIIGEISGVRVILMNGRHHLYEGWSPSDVVLPIRVLAGLGVKNLIITNAAGALNEDLAPGEIMVISDHINMTGQNPLIGSHDTKLGLRFPDMSEPYNKDLRNLAVNCFKKYNISCREGIYTAVTGPSLETSAERRFLKLVGADAVGMSTVMEVIAARQCGFKILGLSAITNNATGSIDQRPDSIEEVVENAARVGKNMVKVFPELIKVWSDKNL